MAELIEVKIKGIVSTARYGTLETGDILRTDAEYAKHLVEQCGAGEYVKRDTKTPLIEAEAEAKPKSKVKK